MADKDTATKELTPEDVIAKRAALMAELAELPSVNIPAGLEPGTRVGEGLTSDSVPFTEGWYTDVEARRKDLDANGQPKWPNYQLHTVIANKTETIRVNGVGFMVIGGQECKLPSPHYNVYRDTLDAPKRLAAEFAPPTNPNLRPGYVSPPHLMGSGFLRKDNA